MSQIVIISNKFDFDFVLLHENMQYETSPMEVLVLSLYPDPINSTSK